MPYITREHPFLDFENNFKEIPLCQIDDNILKSNLSSFLLAMNSEPGSGDVYSLIYGYSHCDWMVGHGLQHSRDIWVIANRFFDMYKQDSGLPQLNDLEKYCLSCAIWLHDIGMSTVMAPLNSENIAIENFWKENTTEKKEFPKRLNENLIRKFHSFLSKYFILNPVQIDSGNPIEYIQTDELKMCIAIICCYHQSKWQFHDERGNGFFGTLTNERIGKKELKSGIYRTSKYVDINILYLSALLRFFDECDQITSRIADATAIENNNKNKLSRNYDRILGKIENLPNKDILKEKWNNCKPPDIYTKSKDKSKKRFEEFEKLLNNLENKDARDLILDDLYELYKSISIETHSHFIAKVILDIGFGIENNNHLIIRIQCNPQHPSVKDFKTGVIENLTICQRFFSSNPTENATPLFNMDDLFRCFSEDNTHWVCDSPTERRLRESEKKKIVIPPDNPDYTSLPVITDTGFCNTYVEQFTGREWLYEEINDFFKENQKKNIYAVIAPKGFGKTAIACQAREKIDFCKDIHICHSKDFRSCNPILWINKIIRCLAESDDHVREQINAKVSALEESLEESLEKDPGAYFSYYFSDLTIENERIYFVFVVDGLDEAYAKSGESDNSFYSLFKYTTFPSYIKILVTSRPGIKIGGERTKNRIESKNINPQFEDNLSNLEEYIRNRIGNLGLDIPEDQRNAFINTLNIKSAGIFLYAKVILDAIRDEYFSFADFERLPDRLSIDKLSDFYEEMFQTRFSTEQGRQLPYYNDSKNLLAVYCTNDYIPDSLIAALNKNGEVNITHKDLIKQFLIRSDKNSGFFHGSMREWLLEEGNRYYSIRDQYSSINSAICDICKEKFDDPELGDYSRINLFQHFMNTERYAEASDLLKNPEYLTLKIRKSEYYELLSEFREIFSIIDDDKNQDTFDEDNLKKIYNFLVQRSYVLKKNPGLVEQEIINFGPHCIRIDENNIKYSWLELENKRNLLYDQLFDDHGGPIKKIELVQNYLFAVGSHINSQFSSSYISLWDLQSGKYDRISVRSEGNEEEEPPTIKSICVSGCDNTSISIFCGLDKSEECEIKKIQYSIKEKTIDEQITISIHRPNKNTIIKMQDIRYCNGRIICNIGEYLPQAIPDGFDEEAASKLVYLVKNYIYVLNQNEPNNGRFIDTKKIVNCIEVHGNTLLLGCRDGSIGVYNPDRLKLQFQQIHNEGRSVNCISIRDNGIAASGDEMGNICRWRIDPFIDLKNTFNLNRDHERKPLYSLIHYKRNDNSRYLIAAGSGDIFFIEDNLPRLKILRALFLSHKKKISSLKILNNRFLLSTSTDTLIKKWDLDKLSSPDAAQEDFKSKLIGTVNILLKSADGEYLIFGSTNQSEHAVKIWKYQQNRFDFHKQIVSENHVGHLLNWGNEHLILCDTHGGILQCEIDSDNRFHPVAHVSSPIQCIDCCDNNKICVATQSNHIRFIDVANRRIGNSWVFLGSIDEIPPVLFNPRCFAINGELGTIRIKIPDQINVLKLNDGGFIVGSINGLFSIFQNGEIITHELNVNIENIFIVQPFLIIPCRDNDDYQIRIYRTRENAAQGDVVKIISLGVTALTQSGKIALSVLQSADKICLWYSAGSNIYEYWVPEGDNHPNPTNISTGKITLRSFELKQSIYLVVGGKNDLKVWKRVSQGNYSLSASFNFETEVVNCIYLLKEDQPYLICGSAGGDIFILKLKNFGV